MNCFQLHLNVNQRLQEVASFKRDKFRPEEIDLALNKAMDRLILEAVDNNFQGTQINLSHITGLIKKTKPLEVITPGGSDPVAEDNIDNSYSVIPPDFYYLVDGRVEIVTDPLDCSTAPTVPTANYAEWKAIIPFPQPNASAPYFPSFTITSSVSGSLYSSPTAISAGFQNRESQYVLVNNILERLAQSNSVRVYWERYRDTYYNNSFIFVSNSNLGTISLTATGVTATSQAMSSTVYTIYNRASIPASAGKQIVPVKVTKENLLYSSLKQNSFYDSGKDEVVADQTLDYLIFYGKESFIITRAYIDYIRKPRTISLLLGQTCELADSVHNKVVDLAVEILRLDTKDQAYPQTVQDTQLRTI